MRKIFFVAALAASSLLANAQDIIVRKGGDVENVKVLEVTPTEVKYKKYDNPEGPTFTERRSSLISVKYASGEVQKFNDSPGYGSGNGSAGEFEYYEGYGREKKFTNELNIYIANGWGIGYQLRREFSPYIAWNIFGVSYMSGFDYSPADAGGLNIRLLGARGYTPSWRWIRGYVDLNMGYSMSYGGPNTDIYHNFGLDFSTGVQVHKNIAIGYNLTFTAPDKGKTHMARIAFLF